MNDPTPQAAETFDEAVRKFRRACARGEDFKNCFDGGAYMTRIEVAYGEIEVAYNEITEAFQAVQTADARGQ
jgi:hypothetical protein